MNSGAAGALATAAMLVLSCSVTAGRAQSLDNGRALAERLCASCHMNEGQGEKSGPHGIPGFHAVANRPQQTHADVVRWLRSVPPMMPNHHLSRDEMDDLAEFIMSLRRD